MLDGKISSCNDGDSDDGPPGEPFVVSFSFVLRFPLYCGQAKLLFQEKGRSDILFILNGGVFSQTFINPPSRIGTYVTSTCLKTFEFYSECSC